MQRIEPHALSDKEEQSPDILQRRASNPDASIWVGASAGTGKTKVLTDRVLRILLPRDDGRPGTPAHKILCLTFTKAAANEMALRINKILSSWAVMDELSLTQSIAKLLGKTPSLEQVNAAQKLFANVIDCPGRLQITTIHSFCQSVLGRFPMEAGITPHFEILDDARKDALIRESLNDCVLQADDTYESTIQFIVSKLGEDRFLALVRDMCSERHQINGIYKRFSGIDGVYSQLCEEFDLDPEDTESGLLESACVNEVFAYDDILRIARSMNEDKAKRAQENANKILHWLSLSPVERATNIKSYMSAFLTQKGEVKSVKGQGLPPSSTLKNYADARLVLEAEAHRLIAVEDRIKSLNSARLTRDILHVSHSVLVRFEEKKNALGVLDFDDLVLKTMALLTGKSISFSQLSSEELGMVPEWVMYKMDQGLDHILVDEAQDTNPEQWRIIEAISDEFYRGYSTRDDSVRTSFTVGDAKQSIYSFQRASPQEFDRMHDVLKDKVKQSGAVFDDVGLNTSFRTTQSVLRVVDALFKKDEHARAISGEDIHHQVYRKGQAGLVELWPVFAHQEKEQRDFWDPPIVTRNHQSGSVQLAEYIAQNIRNWLDRKEKLESANRPVEAGDIMILVRSRSAFVDQMVRALKMQKIPVSGADRMLVTDQLAVQDILSVVRFCLLPSDDLSLAEVLKSPFLGWDEDDLFALSYNRKGSLWQEVCNFDHDKLSGLDLDKSSIPSAEKCKEAWDYLSRLVGRARYLGAYEFCSLILNRPCPGDLKSGFSALRGRLGDEAIDPVQELLNVALDFGRNEVDNLQVFLDAQESNTHEIKREMEEGAGEVRIMTIHGSKGLQAPIVIMPDTLSINSGKKINRFLWPDKTGRDVPFYAERKNTEPQLYKHLKNRVETLSEDEELRLLYVAMTRAADRLYVAGHRGTRDPSPNSWYYLIKDVMQEDEQCQEIEGDVLRIENLQTQEPDKAEGIKEQSESSTAIPEWAFTEAIEESALSRPLMPSKPSIEEEDIYASPLVTEDERKFRRGIITHKLLQFLPDFELDDRRNAATAFVHKNAIDIENSMRESIVEEVLAVLNHPEFSAFFAKGSVAEVSVSGVIADQVISGQIDRLVISEKEIWIVDYKTNRPPPKKPEDVLPVYRKQLFSYRDLIQKIYPDHTIHCGLLWTDGPFFMPIQ